MSDTVISVENLSKRYRLGEIQRSHALTEAIATQVKRRIGFARRDAAVPAAVKDEGEVLWALKDVSFTVARGEVLGIIGRNGAGKSTLLKILSRITEPSSGRIVVDGRVGSLLEVGTGFHPELTGRENIYLNGTILGMSESYITKRFDEIVDFSEIGQFIDTPVKRYSSGMYTRLAFAVAAHLDPPILVVDEVLSVGDAAFQKKCLGKIDSLTRGGRTVIFVSHNMGAISELCSKAVLLHRGQLHAWGPTAKVIESYVHLLGGVEQGGKIAVDDSAPCSILSVSVADAAGIPAATFDIADEICISIVYHARVPFPDLQMAAILSRNMVEVIYAIDSDNNASVAATSPGIYRATYRVPAMTLKAGGYSVRATAGTASALLQEVEFAATFDIEELSINTIQKGYRKDRPGFLISPGTWSCDKLE